MTKGSLNCVGSRPTFKSASAPGISFSFIYIGLYPIPPNKEFADAGKGKKEERSIDKKTGKAGSHLPPEFQRALDAYNKGR